MNPEALQMLVERLDDPWRRERMVVVSMVGLIVGLVAVVVAAQVISERREVRRRRLGIPPVPREADEGALPIG